VRHQHKIFKGVVTLDGAAGEAGDDIGGLCLAALYVAVQAAVQYVEKVGHDRHRLIDRFGVDDRIEQESEGVFLKRAFK